MRASGRQAKKRALLGLALLAQLLCCSGQGLQLTTSTRGSQTKAYERVLQYTKDGASFRDAYAANPQAACRLNRKSLCGATAGTDDYVKLQVASSPAEYDARYDAGSDFNPIGPAKDQRPCHTAVAFAVTAAAEAAAASALQINGNSISLSQQDLQFCPGIPRGCNDDWDLKSGLERLVNADESVVDYDCLPYTAARSDDPAKLCNYRCRNKPKALAPGKFGYTPIRDVISAQKQIQRYGSFVTRFNLYDDFSSWLSKGAASNPAAVYDCPNTGKPAADGHAVTVIGYNNNQGYWIVKNSWGPDSGNKGFFKVKYGVCGIMLLGDTYGVYYIPDKQRPLIMSSMTAPSASKAQKCYMYQAQKGDTLNKIADRTVVSIGQLLFDNIQVIRDLNKPLTGARLRICNPDPASVTLPGSKGGTKPQDTTAATKASAFKPRATEAAAVNDSSAAAGAAAADTAAAADSGSSSPSTSATPRLSPSLDNGIGLAEAQVLLAFKTSLGNPPGLNWKDGTTPCGVPDKGVPGWNQVYCSRFGQQQQRVYLLDLSSLGLSGALNATSDLSGLTRLQAIWLSGNQLSGALPANWYKVKNLKEIKLDMNVLTGSLPDEWADLHKIRRLYLNGNRLSGNLPASWGEKMDQLQSLYLASNNLEGSIPSSWAQMANLTSASLYDNQGLTGCIPFQWNTKTNRVRLASGPQSNDGSTTLTLTGTCLCGYCKDQASSSCDGTSTPNPSCTAAAGGAANGTAAGAGPAGSNITAAGQGVSASGTGDTAGNHSEVSTAAANGAVSGGTVPGSIVPGSAVPGSSIAAGTMVPGSTIPGSTVPGGTAASGAVLGTNTTAAVTTAGAVGTSTAPVTAAGGAAGSTAAGTTAAGTNAVAAPGALPGTSTTPVVTPTATSATPGSATAGSTGTPTGTSPGVLSPTALTPGSSSAPAPGGLAASTPMIASSAARIGTASLAPTVEPTAAAAPVVTPPATQSAANPNAAVVPPASPPAASGTHFGAVNPSGTLSPDSVDATVVPDNRKENLMSTDNSSSIAGSGGSGSIKRRGVVDR